MELDWQEPGWQRAMAGIPDGAQIPVERFFALLGTVDEAYAAARALESRGIGLDVSRLPLCTRGAAAQRLALEAELAKKNRLPEGLDSGDPLRLYWQELQEMPRLDEAGAKACLERGEDPNRLTEGLLWLVAQEAGAFAGQGVLLLDLMQEGAMGLMRAMEFPAEQVVESARWHVRQAMARAVALQYLATGEADRLVASVRAYQQADRRLLNRLGRNPSPEELAQELSKPVSEVLEIGKMLRDAATAAQPEKPEAQEEGIEDSAYFQLRTQVEALLSRLEPADQQLLKLRFGLDGRPAVTQAEAAQRLGLSLAELERREAEAMALLRESGGLDG